MPLNPPASNAPVATWQKEATRTSFGIMASWQRNEGFRSKAKASTFKLGFRDHGLPVKVRAPPSLPLLFFGVWRYGVSRFVESQDSIPIV